MLREADEGKEEVKTGKGRYEIIFSVFHTALFFSLGQHPLLIIDLNNLKNKYYNGSAYED
jgi:hypothetical protein